MSTRSRIGIVNADKTITSIYCHNDGYLSHNGRILMNHYKTAQKVRRLMLLGDLSALGETLGKKCNANDYQNRPKGQCIAYKRDRSEIDVDALDSQAINELESYVTDSDQEYVYLFNDNKWTYSENESDTPIWHDLILAVITERLTS